ncbi:MAG: pilus assembly protein N-terminal domain-containing protein [Rhodobacterales bacterium]
MKIAVGATLAVGVVSAMTIATALPVASKEISSSHVELNVDKKERLVVSPGIVWTVVVDRPFGELVIGNAEIVDVFPLSNTSFYVQTRRAGTTNLVFYGENNNFVGEIEFIVARENDEMKLASLINNVVPGASIAVDVYDNRLFVYGEVKERNDVGVVMDIARSYPGLTEPLVFKISYPEYAVSSTTVSVFRGGNVTSYNTPKSQVQASDQWITEYGPIQARIDTQDEQENQTPSVVINVGDQGSLPTSTD